MKCCRMTDGPREVGGFDDSFARTTLIEGTRGVYCGPINARERVSRSGLEIMNGVAVRDTLYYGVAIVPGKSPGMKL